MINTLPGTQCPQAGRVFVCSMADMFGEWVPQEWTDQIFDASVDQQKRVKVTEKVMRSIDVAVRWISVEPISSMI